MLSITAVLVLSGLFGPLARARGETPSSGAATLSEEPGDGMDWELPRMTGWFTENRGQITNDDVRFVHSGPGCSFGFVNSGYLLRFSGENGITTVMKVSFEGAREVMPEGLEELGHRSNFFLGSDSAGWRTDVPNYAKLMYRGLYPGIDLVFSAAESGLKYDLLVAPGANPGEIRWSYHGAGELRVDDDGSLRIITPSGELREAPLFCYQQRDGKLVEVNSWYWVDGITVAPGLGGYDPSLPLVIDPLVYSTFLGGNRSDTCRDMVVDPGKNVYITGLTASSNFPTIYGSFDTSHGGGTDVFISKFDPGGDDLVYSTFVGGERSDEGSGIALDSEKNVYVTGATSSEDFPTSPGCYDDSYNEYTDMFVLKLDKDGSDLVYSTFVGGGDLDRGKSIGLDSENAAYVTGSTRSSDFPTTSGCFDNSHDGDWDVAVFKLDPDGSDLEYSTFLGGDDLDASSRIVLDTGNSAYITGRTESGNFPASSGCYDSSHNGKSDVFICKLNSKGSDLYYSTFIGDEHDDSGRDIVLDPNNNAYIIAYNIGSGDTMIYNLNRDGSRMLRSRSIGGGKKGSGRTIALDAEGCVYVTGQTSSSDFPTTPGCLDDSYNGDSDIFLCKLDSDELEIVYSTFLGGAESDSSQTSVLGPDGAFYLAGATESPGFPTTGGCYDDSHNGDNDVFVLKLDLTPPEATISSITPELALVGAEVRFSGSGTDSGEVVNYLWTSDLDGELYNGSDKSFRVSTLGAGTHQISLKVQDDDGLWSREAQGTLTVHQRPVATIDSITPSPAELNGTVQLQGSGTDDGTITSYAWRSSRDGELYQGNEPDLSLSNLSLGRHTISFKAMDDHEVWSVEASESLVVTERPLAAIKDISPDSVTEGKKVWFNATVTDDGDIEEYVWSSSIDGELYKGGVSGLYLDTLSTGTHTITLRARDEHGMWSEEVYGTLQVSERPVPVIDSASPEPATVGAEVQFRGSGSDDGSIVKYSWDFDDSDGIGEDATGALPTHSYPSPGRYRVTLTVTDDEGITGSTSHEVRVGTLLDSIDDGTSDVRDSLDEKVGGHPDIDISSLKLFQLDDELIFQMEVVGEIRTDSLLVSYYFSVFLDRDDDVTDVDDAEYFVFYISGYTLLEDEHEITIAEDLEHKVEGRKLEITVPQNKIKGGSKLRFNGVSVEFSDFSFMGGGLEPSDSGYYDFGGDIEEDEPFAGFGSGTVLGAGLVFVCVLIGAVYFVKGRRESSYTPRSYPDLSTGRGGPDRPGGQGKRTGSDIVHREADLLYKEDPLPNLSNSESGTGTTVKKVKRVKKVKKAPPSQGQDVTPREGGSVHPAPAVLGGSNEVLVPLDEPEPTVIRKRCVNCKQTIEINSPERPLVVVCSGCQKRYRLTK